MAGPRRPSGLKVMCMGSCLYVVCASMCARVCRCVCTYKCFVYKTAVVVQGRIMYEHEYMTVCARVCESRFTCVFMVLCVLPVVYARTRMCTPLLTCYVHTAFDMKTRTVPPPVQTCEHAHPHMFNGPDLLPHSLLRQTRTIRIPFLAA